MASTQPTTAELSSLPIDAAPHTADTFNSDEKALDEKAASDHDVTRAISNESDEHISNYLANGKERPIETANDIATRWVQLHFPSGRVRRHRDEL
jgi:hypothetical protein